MVGVTVGVVAHEATHINGGTDEIDSVLDITAIPKLNHLVDIRDSTLTWTNMPEALTELNNDPSLRRRIDLSNYREVRIIAKQSVSGAGSALVRGQYSTDDNTYVCLGSGYTPVVTVGSTGWRVSAWAALVAGAKADVYIRLAGINGSGIHDPAWTWMALEFR